LKVVLTAYECKEHSKLLCVCKKTPAYLEREAHAGMHKRGEVDEE
jgi:hypothetical protein